MRLVFGVTLLVSCRRRFNASVLHQKSPYPVIQACSRTIGLATYAIRWPNAAFRMNQKAKLSRSERKVLVTYNYISFKVHFHLSPLTSSTSRHICSSDLPHTINSATARLVPRTVLPVQFLQRQKTDWRGVVGNNRSEQLRADRGWHHVNIQSLR